MYTSTNSDLVALEVDLDSVISDSENVQKQLLDVHKCILVSIVI